MSAEEKSAEERAWVRGFFNALAYHCEGTDLEEGIRSTALLTPEEAIAAGAEERDISRPNMQEAFRYLRHWPGDPEP